MTLLILLEITLVPSSHTTYFLSCQDLNTGDNKQFQFSCCCLVLVQVHAGHDGFRYGIFKQLSPHSFPSYPPTLAIPLPTAPLCPHVTGILSPFLSLFYSFICFLPTIVSSLVSHRKCAHIHKHSCTHTHSHTLKSKICRAANVLVFLSLVYFV